MIGKIENPTYSGISRGPTEPEGDLNAGVITDEQKEEARAQSYVDFLSRPNADAINSQITRDQYQYYRDTFIPVERAARGQIRTDSEIDALSKNTGISAGKAFKNVRGDFRRGAGRLGISLSSDQEAESDKLFGIGGTGRRAGIMTRVRSNLHDINLQNRGEYVGLGRSIATGAQSSLSDAASSQFRTKSANDQIEAQEKAAMMSTIGTITAAAVLMGV